MTRTAVLAAASLLMLTGCGGDTEPAAEASPTAEDTPVEQTYGTVVELRDAAIEAGYECANWQQDNVVALAASSGTCSDLDVLTVYATADDLQQQVDLLRDAFEGFEDGADPFLVGPNWIINGPASPALREALGGTVVEP